MSKESREYEVKGNKLLCPVCGNSYFWERSTLMNTPGATFFGFDFANKQAKNYICDECSYIFWFYEDIEEK